MRRITKADMGKGQRLTLNAVRADKGSMVSAVRANASRAPRRAERESGQALVEFALILPLFLLIVVGIIQFGVALNFWLDMQRIANQGARWAVVDRYPLPNGSYCTEHSPAVQREPADRAREPAHRRGRGHRALHLLPLRYVGGG